LSTIQRIRFHHPLTVRGGDICSSCFPSHVVTCAETFLLNGQFRQRCVGVSGAELHNWQIGSCGHPRFARLLAVRILWWRRIHANILHFGSTCAFQIGLRSSFLRCPINCFR
jgi:hypothetical protein